MPEDRDESRREPKTAGSVSRRDVLRLGAIAGAAVPLAGLIGGGAAAAAADQRVELPSLSEKAIQIEEATIAQLQAAMTRGGLTSLGLVDMYLERIASIDESGPTVNSVLQLNPDARKIARQLDHERKTKGPRGPLHGIPVMLKGNIDTGDRMQTTAGSLALVGAPAHQDATVAARLRAAGAVILGKTNLSEWANFRGFNSTSGWSGEGGLTRNPYVLDRNTSGSSSGSAASVAANLTAAGLGTETDGSIISPANNNGVAAIKPTVGLTSRAGVVPISHTQDTVGPHARTVADAAAMLSALVGVDPRDPQTAASAGKFSTDYTQFLDPHALQGARVGVLRTFYTGYSVKTDALFEMALTALHGAGATLVDPADLPTINELLTDDSETIVLFYEFKRDLNNYLATRTGVPIHTLADAIAFNNAHAAQELQYFGQEEFLLAQSDPYTSQQYQDALVRGHMLAGAAGDRRRARQQQRGCPGGPQRRPGVDHRPDQRRSLRRQQHLSVGGRRLPDRQRADGVRRRPSAGGAELHRHRLQRAEADRLRLRLRAGDQAAAPADLPEDHPVPQRPARLRPRRHGGHRGSPRPPGGADGPLAGQLALPRHPAQPVGSETSEIQAGASPLAPAGSRRGSSPAGPAVRTSSTSPPSCSSKGPSGNRSPRGPGRTPTARFRPSRLAT